LWLVLLRVERVEKIEKVEGLARLAAAQLWVSALLLDDYFQHFRHLDV
jgi:hypothetical protein